MKVRKKLPYLSSCPKDTKYSKKIIKKAPIFNRGKNKDEKIVLKKK